MSIITAKDITGNHQVSFDDKPNAKQRYKLDGTPVVGVTTFIKAGFPTPDALVSWKVGEGSKYAINKLIEKSTHEGNFVEWPSLEEQKSIIKESKFSWKDEAQKQASIGTIVHDYAYLSSLKREEEALELLAKYEGSENWDKILNSVYKVDNFNKENKDEILQLETIVASPKYQFAGRFDRLVRRGNLNIISDYKTSGGFYLEQFIQDGAYALAIKEWLGIEVNAFEVIRFGKEDGDFEPLLITSNLKSFKDASLRCLDTYNFCKSWKKDERFK